MSGSVVVLMYHRIGTGPIPGREAREEVYAVPEEAFLAQIERIAACRSRVIPFDDVVRGAHGSAALPRHGVALTFDDGNATDASIVAPALARHGYRAAFFVTPARIGGDGYLDWGGVRSLHAAGMIVGAHGFDHALLPSLDDRELYRQLHEAKREIADRLGAPVRYMSLPGGAGDARVLAAAAAAGYEAVAGSVQARCHGGGAGTMIPRFAIRFDETLPRFESLVRHSPGMLFRRSLRDRIARARR